MKNVYFIRHAKSSWADPSLSDHDRPLNKRGFRDAPFMAKLLQQRITKPDKIVTSSAVRASTTATYFAKAFGISEKEILTEPAIYEAYPEDILTIISTFEPKWNTVLLFGHNPTFTVLANRFSEDYIDNIPTCGIFKIAAPTEDWKEFGSTDSRLTAFYYPKQYFT